CASFSPENVIDGHKARRETVLAGGLEENFQIAIKNLGECYGKPRGQIETYVPGTGVVSSIPDFEIKVTSTDNTKTLLYGNTMKGGTGFFQFTQEDDNTRLIAYSNEWYDMDTRLFNQYFNSIAERDDSLCGFWK
ncbi:hypothetical protein CAPTEDRAFT_217345, partial [Capitella teleta]